MDRDRWFPNRESSMFPRGNDIGRILQQQAWIVLYMEHVKGRRERDMEHVKGRRERDMENWKNEGERYRRGRGRDIYFRPSISISSWSQEQHWFTFNFLPSLCPFFSPRPLTLGEFLSFSSMLRLSRLHSLSVPHLIPWDQIGEQPKTFLILGPAAPSSFADLTLEPDTMKVSKSWGK